MREIKFRGVNTKHGWVYGDLHLLSAHPHIHSSISENYPIIPHSVGQFTGLIDRNGKEIYEGDILRIKIYHNEGQGETFDFREEFEVDDLKGPLWRYYISVVSFDNCAFCVSEDSEKYICDTCGSTDNKEHPVTGYCFYCDTDNWRLID